MRKNMTKHKFLIFLSIIFVIIVSISAASASENLNDTVTATQDDEIISVDEGGDEISSSQDDSSAKTITVVADKTNPNQVLKPTVQPAIDSANAGDTIILQGTFVHCHFTINKPLTIISQDGTIDPCPHHTHEGVSEHGVFYITSEGSGTVIEGFNFINKDKADTPFSILISGASDVVIKNCIMNDPTQGVDNYSGIIIENSKNVILTDLVVNKTINGIKIINSTGITIKNSIISDSLTSAISLIGNSSNINIISNTILNNKNSGINLSAADNVNILSNIIQNNGNYNSDSGSGIYVNTNITKLVVKGNMFLSNGLHAIMYDYRCRNLNLDEGAELLTDVDNNYFEGHSSMILHHRIYVERNYGDLKYDAENDVYGSEGVGNYVDSKSYVYMKHALIFNDIPCGFTYYTNKISWDVNAPTNKGKYDLNLKLNLKQIKNGVYQVSVVDADGNIATDFNNINMIVFLNDYSTVTPQNDNIYRNVSMKNGAGTADFRSVYNSFKTSNNIITSVLPGLSENVDRSVYTQLKVSDSSIPINPKTTLSASKLTTYPLSGSYFSAKLLNSKGKPVSGAKITFKVNSKLLTAKTDKNGVAKIKISLTTKKTYTVTVSYAGSDDYKSSKTTSKITVKTGSKKSKITASNMKVKKNTKKTFKFKLLKNNGKILKSQKVKVNLNGKTLIVKTNSKGIGKITVKLSKVKSYKIKMNFLGNSNFKASSKTCTIKVTK